MARWSKVCCLIVMLSSPRAPGQDDARDIIKKSIAAVGGADRIDRFKGLKSSARGSAQFSGIDAEFTSQTTLSLPGRMKVVATYRILGRSIKTVQMVNGEKMSVEIDGAPLPLSESQKAELKAAFVRTEILPLTPLLSDNQFKIETLDGSKPDGKKYLCVSVSGRGVKDVRLYFDRSTFLLSRYEMNQVVGTKEVKRVTSLGEYKQMQGLRRPTRMTVTLDGKRSMDVTTQEEKLFEKIDDKEFDE